MTEALRHFNHFLESGPRLFPWLVTLVLVAPVATLFHEIGHAAVARLRLDGAVRIRVGGDPPLWRFSVAGIEAAVRPLFVPFGITGACEFDAAAATATDDALIALAGPVASACGALASATALGWTSPGSVTHALVWQATAVQAFSAMLCLLPLTLTDGNGVHRTDGRIALEALRRSHAGHEAPARPRVSPRANDAAPVFAASPTCAACSHARSEHVDLATGERGPCRGQDYDFQHLAATLCTCAAYVPAR